jgi:hypothetical protein
VPRPPAEENLARPEEGAAGNDLRFTGSLAGEREEALHYFVLNVLTSRGIARIRPSARFGDLG